MLPSFAFQWHITDACDQRCKHCYIFSEGACHLASMSSDQIDHVLNDAVQMCQNLGREPYFYLTGGDPILHPDFWRLAEMLHDRDLMWAVMGNPFHLSPEVCSRLKELGCRKYQLSLDGMREIHDDFRMPGSFDCTLNALDMLHEAGIWTAVMTTVSSANANDIPDLIDLMAEKKVDVYAFGRYCPTSEQKSEEYHIPADAYREFLLKCQERIEYHERSGCPTTFQRKDHLWTLLEYEQGKFTIPEGIEPGMVYGGCHCGISHMTITPTGDVYACRRMESCVGNAFEQSLEDIFLGVQMEEHRKFSAFSKCSRCELAAFCRGCPAVAAGYSDGDMYAADPQCWKEIAEDAPYYFGEGLRQTA